MDEKPFPPSKKKLQKARLRGEVPRSKLLASSIFFLGCLLLIRITAPYFYQVFVQFFAFKMPLKALFTTLTLFWAGVITLAILVNYMQTGWLFSWEALKPRWPKGVELEWNLILVVFNIAVILTLALLLIRPTSAWVSANPLHLVLNRCFTVALILACSLVGLGLIDWYWSKRRFIKRMGMSAAEKAEEERENQVKK